MFQLADNSVFYFKRPLQDMKNHFILPLSNTHFKTMKKFIIILFCSTQLSILLAQDYTSFPMENAVWVGSDFVPSNTFNKNYYWHFIVKGQDTLINGIAYKKIDKKGGIRNNNNITAIREKDKIIYLRENNKDTILYDFNIKTGDTINGKIYGYSLNSPYKVIVQAIDSILINNQYRKKYRLKIPNFSYGEIIEGIGCRCGFIPNFTSLDQGGALSCHSVNDKAIFGNGNNGKCDLVSNKEVIKNLAEVQIYPNPVVDKSFLKMPEDVSIDRATVYDVLGRVVKSYDVAYSPLEILKKDYTTGVYFVHIFHKKRLIAFSKFIAN